MTKAAVSSLSITLAMKFSFSHPQASLALSAHSFVLPPTAVPMGRKLFLKYFQTIADPSHPDFCPQPLLDLLGELWFFKEGGEQGRMQEV